MPVYRDPTAKVAIGNVLNPKKQKPEDLYKPVPKDNFIYYETGRDKRTKIYDVFMHYKGYHNPQYGEWVSLWALTRQEAMAMAKNIPVKKIAEPVFVKRRED